MGRVYTVCFSNPALVLPISILTAQVAVEVSTLFFFEDPDLLLQISILTAQMAVDVSTLVFFLKIQL